MVLPGFMVSEIRMELFRRAEENKSIAGQSSREFNLITNEIKRRKGCK